MITGQTGDGNWNVISGNRTNETYKILDIGTGPGFFSIILAEAGYQVTAVDYTEAMLEEAKKMQEHSHKRSHIVRWMPVILHLRMKHLMQ